MVLGTGTVSFGNRNHRFEPVPNRNRNQWESKSIRTGDFRFGFGSRFVEPQTGGSIKPVGTGLEPLVRTGSNRRF
ncbi:hypothetical protein JCGZ_22232 [Jatropha curcas]|uniref:Uncharacterized protein n=1 Tax=Jatropha curcas TaxID=180498 RepID=A0A067JQ98_JATCU|nr:hypothetical protein JCGZ_22232 [Jatropha curcas]